MGAGWPNEIFRLFQKSFISSTFFGLFQERINKRGLTQGKSRRYHVLTPQGSLPAGRARLEVTIFGEKGGTPCHLTHGRLVQGKKEDVTKLSPQQLTNIVREY